LGARRRLRLRRASGPFASRPTRFRRAAPQAPAPRPQPRDDVCRSASAGRADPSENVEVVEESSDLAPYRGAAEWGEMTAGEPDRARVVPMGFEPTRVLVRNYAVAAGGDDAKALTRHSRRMGQRRMDAIG